MRIEQTALVVALAMMALSPAAPADPAAPSKSSAKPAAAKPADDSRDPRPRLGDYLAGRAAQREHDWKAAALFIHRAWEADRENTELRHDALLLSIVAGDFSSASEIARIIPPDSGDVGLATVYLALDDFAGGRYAPAAAKLAAAPNNGIDRYLVPLLNAWCEVGRGRKEEAFAALAPITGPDELAAAILLQNAMMAEALGDKTQASVLYGKLLEGKPTVRASVAASGFYQRQGNADQARAAVESLDADGAQSSLRSQILARLGDKGRIPPAPDPRSGAADVLLEVASSLSAQKQADIAPLLYTQFALRLRPNFPAAQLLLSQLDDRLGRLDDSAAALLAVDEKSDLRSTAERLAMNTLDRAGQTDKALKLGQAAVKAHPEDVDLAMFNADLLREKSHFPESIAAYDALLNRIPGTSNRKGIALFHRGMAYQQSHQWPHAEADLLAALQLRPDDPAVLNYLGFSWADQGINLDRARTMVERALSLVPDDGAIVDSLGWVMFRSGDYDDAVKQLERAVSLDTNSAEINDHLGDAYWRAGRLIEARIQWEKAQRLTADKALAEQIRIKLRDGLEPETTPRRAAVN